jgi:hypothetical protein
MAWRTRHLSPGHHQVALDLALTSHRHRRNPPRIFVPQTESGGGDFVNTLLGHQIGVRLKIVWKASISGGERSGAERRTNSDLRLLGVVVPEIDALVADRRINLPSPARPILPLWLRPTLLAAVSLVERRGPAMLAWLRSKTVGQNRTRFGELATPMLGIPTAPEALSLLQHN